MDQPLLTVSQLAKQWKCSEDFIYRRCNKNHPKRIPHVRLTPRDIRFDPKMIAGYLLSLSAGDNLGAGSAVRGGCMTRNRDKKGTLLIRGKSGSCTWCNGRKAIGGLPTSWGGATR